MQLTNRIGLHARPAIQLTKLAKRFSSQIQIRTAPESPWIDAKSIVQVMAAKAPKDTVLEIATNGEDAQEALQNLVELIQSKFGESPADSLEVFSEAGHIASRGLAIGKAVFHHQHAFDDRPSGTVEDETRIFHQSINAAQSAIRALIDNTEKDIAEVLEFQLALVQDRSLIDPVVAAIAAGAAAHAAWTQAMNEQLRRYEAADDPYFRGRTSDLLDLKRQVLNYMFGETEALPPLNQVAFVFAEYLSPSDFAKLNQRYCKGLVLKKGQFKQSCRFAGQVPRYSDADRFENGSG